MCIYFFCLFICSFKNSRIREKPVERFGSRGNLQAARIVIRARAIIVSGTGSTLGRTPTWSLRSFVHSTAGGPNMLSQRSASRRHTLSGLVSRSAINYQAPVYCILLHNFSAGRQFYLFILFPFLFIYTCYQSREHSGIFLFPMNYMYYKILKEKSDGICKDNGCRLFFILIQFN